MNCPKHGFFFPTALYELTNVSSRANIRRIGGMNALELVKGTAQVHDSHILSALY